MPKNRYIETNKSMGEYDPTSPSKIISISGLDSPFEEISTAFIKTLQNKEYWSGLAKPLEKCSSIVEIQAKLLKKLYESALKKPDSAIERFKNKVPMLSKSDFLVYEHWFSEFLNRMLGISDISNSGNNQKPVLSDYLTSPENLIEELAADYKLEQNEILLALNAVNQVFSVHAAQNLRKYIEYDTWTSNYCPICGESPEMGKIAKQDGHFYLVCSLCMTEYKSNRVGCPFCGNLDMEKLGHFSVEEYPSYQVKYCHECGSYLKAGFEKELNRRHLPIFDNIMTLELDSCALAEGFKSGEVTYK
jgi:formate dehydrogenase accessory protein FdhE